MGSENPAHKNERRPKAPWRQGTFASGRPRVRKARTLQQFLVQTIEVREFAAPVELGEAPGLDKLRRIVPEVRVALVQGLADSLMTREIGRAIGKVLVSLRLDTAASPEAKTAADLVRKAVASHDRPMMLAGVVAALPPEELAATGPEQAEGLAAALASGPAEDRQLLMRLLLGLLRAGEEAEMSFLRAFGRAEAADPGKIAPALVRSLTLGEAASLSRGALEVLYQTLVEAGASRVLLRQLEEALA